MAFYMQTDDRDDYFAQFDKKRATRRMTGITLTSPLGEVLFTNAPSFKIRTYAKKNYIPHGTGAKRIWRKVLLDKGYKVENNYIDLPQPPTKQ